VDEHLDFLLRVFAVEVEKLGDDQVRALIVDFSTHDHNPLFQQQRVNIVGALPAPRGLYYHRHHTARHETVSGHHCLLR
jgi:hypothetical protein